MIENASNPEVTDISQVKFTINPASTDSSENVNIPMTDVSKNEAEKPVTQEGTEGKTTESNADSGKDPLKAEAQKPDDKNKPENNTPTEQEPIQLTPEDEDHLLNEISGGRVKSYDDLEAKLARLEEIEKNPAILFTDPNKAKIFDFLSKYQGGDYGLGIQTYAKLQQMNIESMDSDSALKEVFMLENVKMGLSREKAEMLWEDEKATKYDSKGDLGEVLKERDAIQAKQKLAQMKQDTNVPKVDSQQEQAQALAKQARETYLSQVDHVFQNEHGQFKELKLSFSDNKDEDFTFEMPNNPKLKDYVSDQGLFNQERYLNEKGEWDVEQVKVDIALLTNIEEIMQNVFEHGVTIGKERNMRERTNTPASNNAASNAAQNGARKSLEQSILEKLK